MKITLIKKNKESENIFSFVFEPEKEVKWKAGQYLFLKIPHRNPDDRGEKRHFTISSAPHEKNIMITTKFDFENGSSFKKALINLEEGSTIEASGPSGDFIIEYLEEKYAFIAGGIGVTPYRSMIFDMETKNSGIDSILLYFSKSKEIIFKDIFNEIEKRNDWLRVEYINEPVRISREIIKEKVADFGRRKFYISGPFKMVKAAEDILPDLKIKKSSIIKDYFPGYK
jgi:glycine betaine catabolism B